MVINGFILEIVDAYIAFETVVIGITLCFENA